MNYTKVYNDLIEKRRKYPLDRGLSGCENHHIVPVSEGGTDDAENIIRFTVKKISEKNKGKVVSSETRKKLSDALKGRKIRPEIVEKMRQSQLNNKSSMVVVQYDKNMNFVAEYKSTRDASRITGFSCGNISRCCNGKLKTVKGFIWRFK